MKFKTIIILLVLIAGAAYFVNRKYNEVDAIEKLEFEIQQPIFGALNSNMEVNTIIPLKVTNESDFTITADKINVNAVSDDNDLGNLVKENITIVPGESIVELTLNIKAKQIIGSLPKLLLKKEIIINLTGDAIYRTEMLSVPITVPISKSFDVKSELLDLLKNQL